MGCLFWVVYESLAKLYSDFQTSSRLVLSALPVPLGLLKTDGHFYAPRSVGFASAAGGFIKGAGCCFMVLTLALLICEKNYLLISY